MRRAIQFSTLRTRPTAEFTCHRSTTIRHRRLNPSLLGTLAGLTSLYNESVGDRTEQCWSARLNRPRKRFGQHFLIDKGVARQIVEAAAISPQDTVVEIGPGRGALTTHLVSSTPQLHLVEIDRDLAAALKEKHGASAQVHAADVLRFDFKQVLGANTQPLVLIGNLPYNISTPLLITILGQLQFVGRMVFMLQREVAVRLAAAPGTRSYGRLSVMVNRHCAIERLFDVAPAAFVPPPQVFSTVVRVVPRQQPLGGPVNEASFARLVRDAFSMRRKTLRNALKHYCPDAALKQCGIDPGCRPEQLSVETFVNLTNALGIDGEDRELQPDC